MIKEVNSDKMSHHYVITPVNTINSFRRFKNIADMIALYSFYLLTSRIQGTNQIKCLNCFSAKGLKLSAERIKAARKNLTELGLVESIVKKNTKTKKIESHYVKLPFLITDAKSRGLFVDEDWLFENIPSYAPWDYPTPEIQEEMWRPDLEEMGIL
jgi:hypothetical protein